MNTRTRLVKKKVKRVITDFGSIKLWLKCSVTISKKNPQKIGGMVIKNWQYIKSIKNYIIQKTKRFKHLTVFITMEKKCIQNS